MNKKLILALLIIPCYALAGSDDSQLLKRAISCKLSDQELPTLMQTLAGVQPAFKTPYAAYGAPTANVYQVPNKVSALGYQSSEIVVTPARILLAVPQQTVADATRSLKLEASTFSPASRDVRPTVSIVAFQLSHAHLKNKLLVGCQYASNAAAAWPVGSTTPTEINEWLQKTD